jgi:hypothetical protein
MSWKLLSVQKKLASLDGSWPQEAGAMRLGVALSIVPGTFAPNWAVVGRAMLRILDWWMVSKSWFYSRRRPNCQLDLWDTGGRGKYPVAALSARVASQDSARWVKILGNPQIQGFGCYSTISNSGMSPFLNDS